MFEDGISARIDGQNISMSTMIGSARGVKVQTQREVPGASLIRGRKKLPFFNSVALYYERFAVEKAAAVEWRVVAQGGKVFVFPILSS